MKTGTICIYWNISHCPNRADTEQSSWAVLINPLSLIQEAPFTTQHLTLALHLVWNEGVASSQHATLHQRSSPIKAKCPWVDSRRPPAIQHDANQRKLDSWAEDAPCRAFPQCSAQVNSTRRRREMGRGTLHKDIGCHITYALPRTERSHLKPNSQAKPCYCKIHTEQRLFYSFVVFNTCHKQRVVCLAGFCLGWGFDGVTLFWFVLAKQD